jgi:hypothetical protein
MPFEVHQTAIDQQTTPLSKILNRPWPGVRVSWKANVFTVTHDSHTTSYRIFDRLSYYTPRNDLKKAWDAYLLVSRKDPNSPEANEEFQAMARAEEPAPRQDHLEFQSMSPHVFQLAKRSISLTKLLELHGVPYHRTEHGTIAFTVPHRRQYTSYPGNEEYHEMGIQNQRLTTYHLWLLLNDIEVYDTFDNRRAFVAYVAKHVEPDVAVQLAA